MLVCLKIPFRTSDFLPHGCFCVYSNHQTLNILEICPFLDVSCPDDTADQRFDVASLVTALQSLIESIQRRAGLLQIYHTLPEQAINPDIRIIMCMLCGDPYSVDHVLGPLLSHQCCFVTTPHTITLETYLAKSPLATLSAFSMNIPNIPIQILAVTETGSANAFFSSDLSHQLITEGNAVADKLQAHFMTSSSTSQQNCILHTLFSKKYGKGNHKLKRHSVLKIQIIQLVVEHQCHLPVPSRQESYHLRSGSLEDGGDSEGLYEQLPVESGHGPDDGSISPTGFIDGPPLSPSDDSDLYASVFNQENGEHLVKPSQIKNRRSLQAELYRQSFPSTESLDRSVSMKSRDNNGPPPPLPPSRHERDPNSGIDLAYPPPTLDTFTGNASPPPSYHSQVHYSPRLPPHPLPLPSSFLKSCGIGMPSTPSAPSLSHTSSGQGSRIPDDLDGSDSITDDDDTISSGLSGDYFNFYLLDLILPSI
ncbi:rho GTPase-activating protein 190 [Caerostris extrusa]|uniref:Rho GTPase-activating protein 190 n=1 Tax=Caerostris extrusa TaxID=172846 RepID=A0AAV4Y3I5_CAEEX|nr:rho GTPase-activating protein 190 [Caerostris extrusa]